MVKFVVVGPFDVPTKKNEQGSRLLEHDTVLRQRVVEQAENDKIEGPGCYVFACSAPRSGAFPIYVGKATKNIIREAFNPRNITSLNHFLFQRRKGKLQLYAIYQQRVINSTGNPEIIGDIEDFLIGYAALRNKNLLNIHGNTEARWSIAGVANHGSGNPGAPAMAFKKMMGMKSRTARPEAPNEEITPTEVESESPKSAAVEAIEAETHEDEN